MPLSDFYMKKLGKMIDDPDYDLNERWAPTLLDAEFIFLDKWGENSIGFHMDYSFYTPTDKGKQAYFEWIKILEHKEKGSDWK